MKLRLHKKQQLAFMSEAREILYGGSAGSGKSHLMRACAIAWCLAVPGLQVYLFRREYPELRKNHFEGPTSFPSLLAEWVNEGHVKYNVSDLSIKFSNGSAIFGCHCQRENDVYGYQGAEIHALIIDELTHFTDFQYRYLRGRCRTGALNIPHGVHWKFPRILAGSNPGGIGHNWVKAAFIDASPPMKEYQTTDDEGGYIRQFIPALLQDNPTINQDEYRRSLKGLGNDLLVKAMLDGSWDIVAGGMFDDVWSPQVVREPEPIPAGWRISRSFDWGSSRPFSVGWWAESDGTAAASGWCPRKGSLVQIAEWYGWNGKPNEGARMLAAEVARGILEREQQMRLRVDPGPADSAIYATQNGNCIADDMARIGVRWTPADKGPGSRINGWELMRKRLKAATTGEDPALYVFSTCRQTIRTIPVLPRDPTKPDDVDSDAEDHAADMIRYRILTPDRHAGAVRMP